jgi:hypothetical protein
MLNRAVNLPCDESSVGVGEPTSPFHGFVTPDFEAQMPAQLHSVAAFLDPILLSLTFITGAKSKVRVGTSLLFYRFTTLKCATKQTET